MNFMLKFAQNLVFNDRNVIKKIVISITLFILSFQWFSTMTEAEYDAYLNEAKVRSAEANVNSAQAEFDNSEQKAEYDLISPYDTPEQREAREQRLENSSEAQSLQNAKNELQKAEGDLQKAQHLVNCAEWWSNAWNCIDQPTFQIKVSDISPGGNIFQWSNTEQTANSLLGTIIQKLMVALWSLSLLIMTIGAGYMILYHGQDELLSKWKSIFISGIVALAVALSSYYLVAFIRFILYSQTQ